jgi:hypothetical protein
VASGAESSIPCPSCGTNVPAGSDVASDSGSLTCPRCSLVFPGPVHDDALATLDASSLPESARQTAQRTSAPGAARDASPSFSAAFLAQYQPVRFLGRGAMGSVHLMRQVKLDRLVAVKVVRAAEITPEQAQLLMREARLLAGLNHPNILAVYDVGSDGALPYMVCEYVKGETLALRLKRAPRLTLPQCLRVLIQILDGLRAAHARNVVHRDLKPENVFLTSEGRPKIGDFGLAREQRLTSPGSVGVIVGTPAYMSPEQCQGLPAGPASDLYSAGALLFEMITGQTPFPGPTVADHLYQHIRMPSPALLSLVPTAPIELETIVSRALAKEPSQRFGSAFDFQKALLEVYRGLAAAAGAPAPAPAPGAGAGRGGRVTQPGSLAPAADPRSSPGWGPSAPASAPGSPAGIGGAGGRAGRLTGRSPEIGPAHLVPLMLGDTDPDRFCRDFQDVLRVTPDHLVVVREAAQQVGRRLDWSSQTQGPASFTAFLALLGAIQSRQYMPVRDRQRVLGQALWFVAQAQPQASAAAAAAAEDPGEPGNVPIDGDELIAALESLDVARTRSLLRAGVSDPTTRKKATDLLLQWALPDLGSEGLGFLGAWRTAELAEAVAWQGARDYMMVPAYLLLNGVRDRTHLAELSAWAMSRKGKLAGISQLGEIPARQALVQVDEALREGGPAALDAIRDVASRHGGWISAWEALLLAFSRLIFKAGPIAGEQAARAYSYLVALRASQKRLKQSDKTPYLPLLGVPLFTRLAARAMAEPAAPRAATAAAHAPTPPGAHPVEAAIDSASPQAVREAIDQGLKRKQDEEVIAALSRRAAGNGEAAGFATALQYMMAAIGTYMTSGIEGKDLHLHALGAYLARTGKAHPLQDQMAKMGM